MNRCVVVLFSVAFLCSCAQQQRDLPPPPCVWDAELIDRVSDTHEHYPFGPFELRLEGPGVQCLIPPIIRDAALVESALLFCQYDDSKYIFSAEVQVDPRNDEPSERMNEFVFRRGFREPFRVLLACK